MTLVYACIAPHGGEIIPELASKAMLPKFEETRVAMRVLAKRISETHPHTVVIASPHNLRLVSRIAVVVSENSSGTLKGVPNRSVSLQARCDIDFGRILVRQAEKEGLPVVGANYGTATGSSSDIQMDWGTLVPLWFILKERKLKPKILIVTPSREIPLRKNFVFGQLLGRLMSKDRKRKFVFIASADQAHAHSRTGPYGFSRAAQKYDDLVLRAIRDNNLKGILRLKPRFIEDAKPDSLWQMVILAGINELVPLRSQLLSYQVPSYYGMVCAGFEPN
jgi:aromatic ring-opening dioxygenase LigB subunit